MAGFYRTEREALIFTAPFGIDPLLVTPSLASLNLWHELLARLAAQGTVPAAVAEARKQYPKNPYAPFLDALLADRPAPTSAEPLSEEVPAFDDTVSGPEALLFFDDLTIPVGRVPNLIAALDKMIEAAPAVCSLRVESSLGDFFGTGFRISRDLVLTNYHVLFPKEVVATGVSAVFGIDVDASGASTPVTSLVGVTATIQGEIPEDWAVIQVPGMSPDWPILVLDPASTPRVGDFAYILQHPGAQQKRLGFVRNMISDVQDGVVRYLTDTRPGSSGAPVLDSEGRLIALHYAGGRPVEILGKPPVAKNAGIRTSRVLERLKANGIMK
jgi:S1-C subfamily serine protease